LLHGSSPSVARIGHIFKLSAVGICQFRFCCRLIGLQSAGVQPPKRTAATCHSEPPVVRSVGESNGSLFNKVTSYAPNS
jgi:hypothetical protein